MTQSEYRDLKGIKYKGKHCKKTYHVWKVLGPAGPLQEYDILGLDEARKSVEGAWDAEITRIEDGRVIQWLGYR